MINNAKLENICIELQNAYESGNTLDILKAEHKAYDIFNEMVKMRMIKLSFLSDDIKTYVHADAVTSCLLAVKKFKLYASNTFLGMTGDGDIIGYSKKDGQTKVSYPLSVCCNKEHVPITEANIGELKEGDDILIKNNCFSFFITTIINSCSTSMAQYKKAGDVSLSIFENNVID